MTTIGIVGAGIAGLHLALHLQKQGVSATIYTERSGSEIGNGRLLNSVALMGATQARDRALGTHHWDTPEQGTPGMKVRIAGDPPLALRGEIAEPFLFIDMRVYLPRLMDDFAARGGDIKLAPCAAGDLDGLAAAHDLLVVATGRAGLSALFPRVAERSPYHEPQRRLFAGLFRGVELPHPFTMEYNIIPGAGEIFENQFLTRDGYVAAILIEAIPGGVLEPLTHLRYEDDPRAFDAALLAALREHTPDTYARIDPAAFALRGPLDTLAGAIVPTARLGWAALPGGRLAVALGDAHVTHDPITGQGANAASRAAFLLGDMLIAQAQAGGRFDEAFCAQAEPRIWDEVRAVTEWTNAFLQPPPPHAIGLLVAAAQNQALADAFASNFNHPKRQWEVFSSPDATAAFIAGFQARPS